MGRPIGKIIKRILLGVLALVVVLALIYHNLVAYGIRQGYGQLNIIWNARPVTDYLADPNFPDFTQGPPPPHRRSTAIRHRLARPERHRELQNIVRPER